MKENILKKIFDLKKEKFSELEINSFLEKTKKTAKENQKKTESFSANLKGKKEISIIAEIKIASPSHGKFKLKKSIPDIVREYEEAGARAISVVTEENFFKGSREIFSQIRAITKLPIIRKDFFWHPLQIAETASLGAQAVLLISAGLKFNEIKSLVREAQSLDIEVLLETHSVSEFKQALELDVCLGINNRNLQDMTVDVRHCLEIISNFSKLEDRLLVSESGISKRQDLEKLRGKFDAVLIGTSFLEEEYPGRKLREFVSI